MWCVLPGWWFHFQMDKGKCWNSSLEYLIIEVSPYILILVCFEKWWSPAHITPYHPILIFEWPRGLKPYLMFISSRSATMDTAHHISVTHLVNTACGGIQQVRFCKLSSSAKLQLCNVHTKKFLVRKTCKIKIFTKVDQIIDKQFFPLFYFLFFQKHTIWTVV